MARSEFDIIVIGAGIAGASFAAHVAPGKRIAILEQEQQPGYHSTGRSAAIFSGIYGSAPVRALSRATRRFFDEPPPGFGTGRLHRPRGALMIADREGIARLDAFAAQPDVAPLVQMIGARKLLQLVPVLRPEAAAAAIFEAGATEIDVHALHQGYLRQAAAAGCVLLTGSPVTAVTRDGGRWLLETRAGRFAADIIVNAAGAWADAVAGLAGIGPMPIIPKRRTVVLVRSGIAASDGWPMMIDIDERFYIKPEVGRLLLSPADETDSPACDCQPDEWDVALAVDRVEKATTLRFERIEGKWAGLRSYAPDRIPVIGFDPRAEGFFWLAGQGGHGIQTVEGAACLAAALVNGASAPAFLEDLGLDSETLSPRRLVPAPAMTNPRLRA